MLSLPDSSEVQHCRQTLRIFQTDNVDNECSPKVAGHMHHFHSILKDGRNLYISTFIDVEDAWILSGKLVATAILW